MLFMGSEEQRNERNLCSGQTTSVCGVWLFCLVVLLEGRVPGLHFSVTVIVL